MCKIFFAKRDAVSLIFKKISPFSLMILTAVIVSCLIIPEFAAAGTDSGKGMKSNPRVQRMGFFEDKSGKLGIEDIVTSEYKTKFILRDTVPYYGFTRSAVWIKLTASNEVGSDTEKILEVLYPALNLVEVFIPDRRSGYINKKSGSLVPFSERDIQHRNSLFSIPLKMNETIEVFIRVKSESSLNFKINLHDAKAFHKNDYIEQLVMGVFFGIMFIMFLYNLFLFFAIRDMSYLFYVCYVLSNIMFSLSISGLAHQFIWPDAGEWAMTSSPFFTSTMLFCAVVFSLNFLKIKNYSKVFYWIFLVLAVVTACMIPGTLILPYKYCVLNNVYFSYILLPLIIIISVYTIHRGYSPAKYFLMAWSFLLAGSITYALSNTGIIPRGILSDYGVQVGTVFEVSILALALGDRINILRKEKENYARYRELDRVKSEFIANISHEIRTPLTLMLTPIWSVIDGTYTGRTDKTFFEILDRNGSRLLGLINDLLDFSKLDAGKMTMNVVCGDLLKLIHDHVAIVRSVCDMKKIRLDIECGAEQVMLYFDPEKMESILANLFSNAIGFTSESGRISIRIKENYQDVILEFEDNGSGIPADKIDLIFDRFTQVDSGPSRRYGGTGIGLALIKEFLDLHGGTITVESRFISDHHDDHGTLFIIKLPRGKSHLEKRNDVSFHDEMQTHGSKFRSMTSEVGVPSVRRYYGTDASSGSEDRPLVLAVDDNIDMHSLLAEVLEPFYRVIFATDGQTALDLMSSMDEPPDIIISDVMMPGMDGYTLTRQIRGDSQFEGIPIILLTAKADTSMKIEGLEIGATDYVAKPFSGRELIARVRAQLGMKKLRDRLIRANKLMYSRLKENGKSLNQSPNAEIEEKIRIVSVFIRENYTADLSREGLAAAVDMSPDYLSRMFNRVTGKRLDEFINELRTADAANRLLETGETVLTIAMDTGFESLRHFNRVFSKIYGKNPTEYRLIKKL